MSSKKENLLKCYLEKVENLSYNICIYADMAELADAPDLGSGG